MKRSLKVAVVSAVAAAVAGIALAAPEFVFTKDVKGNAMMMTMNNKEVIELAAYPALKLLARNVTKSQASFVYAGTDLKGAVGFYSKALVSEGWKAAEDAMMKSDDAMKKDDSAMAKDDGMKKDDSTMKKDDAAMKKDDSAMMAKPTVEKFTFKTYTITVTGKADKDRVTVDLALK